MPFKTPGFVNQKYMWCDLGESVRRRTYDILSFLFDWSRHQERWYILLKTPPESDHWFQSYSEWKILKTIENKRNAFLFLAVSHNQCSRLPTLDCNTCMLEFCICQLWHNISDQVSWFVCDAKSILQSQFNFHSVFQRKSCLFKRGENTQSWIEFRCIVSVE